MMFLIILILIGVGVASASMQVTHLEQKFEALVMPAGYIDKVKVKSKTDCARICAPDNLCKSIFYMTDSRQCQTHTQRYTASGVGLVAAGSALYFEKEVDPASTTSTMTTTTTAATVIPTVFTCPSDDTAFRPVTLSDGTQFSYRVLTDAIRGFDEAVSECNSKGSTLLEAVTLPKFNFTQQLMNCSGQIAGEPTPYANLNFWTNGIYNDSTNTWETLTGKPIPMTSDFWDPKSPNMDGVHKCGLMRSEYGHYLDDYGCDAASIDIYTICEKLV